MTRNLYEAAVGASRSQLHADDQLDDDEVFELGDICTPPVGRNVEPVLAAGSNIYAVDGTPLAATPRAKTLDEVDAALIAYLLDLKA